MRIVGGAHRGLALAAPGRGETGLRPTSDRVREALFNILAAEGLPQGARVLDLFAGTGALGLEALSRGAAHATFVESGRTGQRLIRENLRRAGRAVDATVIARDAARLGSGTPHDLVFLDPPYGRGLGSSALTGCLAGGWLAPGARVVWEEDAPQDAPPGFTVTDRRRYGPAHLTFLSAPGAGLDAPGGG